MATDVATLMIKVGADVSEAESGLSRVRGSVEGFASVARGAITTALGFGLAQLGINGLAGAFDAVKNTVIGFNASLEQTQTAFTTLLHNGDAAKAMLSELQQLAAATPYQFEDFTTAARILLNVGFAASEVKPLLIDIGNAAAAAGTGAEGLQRITLALSQMSSAGKVTGQDMLQLINAGVPAWNILAEAMHKPVPEVQKLASEGKIAADVFIKAFQEFEKNHAGDAMEKQAHTFNGAISTIIDSLQIAGSTAFKPLFDAISGLAQKIADFVQSDQFQEWAANVAAWVQVALEALGVLAEGFGEVFGAILDVVVTVGSLIFDALQLINPFARHSPSLVENVEAGVDRILHKYEQLRAIETPLRAAGRAVQELGEAARGGLEVLERQTEAADMKTLQVFGGSVPGAYKQAQQAVRDLEAQLPNLQVKIDEQQAVVDNWKSKLDTATQAVKDKEDAIKSLETQLGSYDQAVADAQAAVDQIKGRMDEWKGVMDDLNGAIQDAQDRIRELAGTPLEGTKEWKDQLFQIQQQIKETQLEMTRMKLAGAPKEDIDALQQQLDQLRLKEEEVRLSGEVMFDPMKKQIQDMTDTSRELPFQDIIAQIQQQKDHIANLQGQLDTAKGAWQEQGAAMQEAKDKLQEATDARDQFKAKIEQEKQQLDQLKDTQQLVQERYDAEKQNLDDLKGSYDELTRKIGEYRDKIGEIVRKADELKSAMEKASGATGGLGNTTSDTKKSVEDAKSKLEEWKNKAEEMAKNLREKVMPAVKDFKKVLEDLAGAIEGIKSVIEGFREPINNFASGVLRPAAENAAKAFEGVGDKIGGIMRPQLEKIGNWWETHNYKFGKAWDYTTQHLGESTQKLTQGMSATFDKHGKHGEAMWGGMWTTMEKNVNDGTDNMLDMVDFFLSAWSGDFETANRDADNIWRRTFDMLGRSTHEGLDFIGHIIGIFWDAIAAYLQKEWDKLVGFFRQAWDNIRKGAEDAWNNILAWLTLIWLAISRVAEDTWNNITNWLRQTWDNIWQKVQEVWNNITNWIGQTWDNIRKGAEDAWNNLTSWLRQTWDNIWLKVQEVWNNITNWIGQTWDNIRKGAEDAWNNLTSWLRQTWDNIWLKVQEIWNNIWKFLGDTWENIRRTVSEKVEGLKNNLIDAWTNVKGKAEEWWNNIWNTITNIWNSLPKSITDTVDGIKRDLEQKWDDIKTGAGRVWDDIKLKVSTVWAGIKDVVRNSVNAIIDFINGLIRGWNSLSFHIPGVIDIESPKLPEIPHLAKGGIVYSPTLALIGESGPEAVIPLSGSDVGVRSDAPIEVHVHVAGSVIAERDLAVRVREELLRLRQRNINVGLA